MIRALDARGHRVTFYEPDAFDRQRHRDREDPPWAKVLAYTDPLKALDGARRADLVVKVSGVGVHDALLEEAVPHLGPLAAFWDEPNNLSHWDFQFYRSGDFFRAR